MKYIPYQIGDYVLIDNNIRKVEMVTKKKVGYHTKENETVMHYARLCEVKGVPITFTKLLKIGFKCEDRFVFLRSYVMEYEFHTFRLVTNDEIIYTFRIGDLLKKLSYIHELQHVLEFYGINKKN